MSDHGNNYQVDFTVDRKNLYHEEAITDLKVASIRRLVPINIDGSEDKSRTPVYIGTSQLMSPHGPLPLQAVLPANNLQEALEAFPAAMERAMADMVEEVQKMQANEKERDDSRIIIPNR
jgi:hypothetical protein